MAMTATQWEYVRVSLGTNDMGTLDKLLDQLGVAGFEMCGWASADKTIGFNGFVGIFKRPGVKHPAPEGVEKGLQGAGWFADPYGVHEHRLWSGTFWTEAVANRGETSVHVPGT